MATVRTYPPMDTRPPPQPWATQPMYRSPMTNARPVQPQAPSMPFGTRSPVISRPGIPGEQRHAPHPPQPSPFLDQLPPLSMRTVGHRYDPYRRLPPPGSQPPRPPQPQSSRPRMMPTTSPFTVSPLFPRQPDQDGRTGDPKANGRYLPSRGAQRDARWQAKQQDIAHVSSHRYATAEDYISRHQHTHHSLVPPRASLLPPAHSSPNPNTERIKAEQLAAIAAARKAHAETIQQRHVVVDEEAQRKIKRIQLQVYVHARSTQCGWKGCPAVLNSWAVLEKHLYHSHLHPKHCAPTSTWTSGGIPQRPSALIPCQWQGCEQIFRDVDSCYQHCLTQHMGVFGARCPFNCLFEGPLFADLMAHIGRRHPQATPDDFVPGLIHHRPEYLPPASSLPKLPGFVVLARDSESGDVVTSLFYCGPVPGFQGDISEKVRKQVKRGCVSSGRRPRKDHFVDKQGASAAIKAMLENSRRISMVCLQGIDPEDQKDSGIDVVPNTATSVVTTISTDEAMQKGVDLVDVRMSVKAAKDAAIDVIAGWNVSGHHTRAAALRSLTGAGDGTLGVASGGKEEDGQQQGGSTSDGSDSDTSSTGSSVFSLYRGAKGPGEVLSGDDGQQALKRSARLKSKAKEHETGE